MPSPTSSSSRGRIRSLRDLPLERVLFVVVLGCSALLLSVVMLRSEQAEGVTKAAPRTFRDGFTVAQETRRAESNGTATALLLEDKMVPVEGGNGVGTQVQVEKQGEHTMTKIKTTDGDEITIKRAANSNKITTISAHEDGKITIENRDEDEATKKTKATKEATKPTTEEKEPKSKEDGEEERTRRAGYEKIALGKETKIKGLTVEDELESPRRIEAEEDTAEELKPKKVTVVEVGRSLTKVSVHQVTEATEEAEEVAKSKEETR